jgi:uncharacterized protein (TIGR02996 family)
MKDSAFVQAILANPDDEMIRLVYADWLDEQGDPRGEFLRLDVALLQTLPMTRNYVEQRDRYLTLRAGIDSKWARSVGIRTIRSIEGLVHFLREFHRFWSVSPSRDSADIPADLPHGLSLLYRELGGLFDIERERSPFYAQDSLVSLKSLKRDKGSVVFAWENSGNWSCKCAVGEKDPPVYSNAADLWNSPTKGFQKICDSLNHFLITFALREAVFSSPCLFALNQTSLNKTFRVSCRPLWLAGKYVYEETVEFFAIPEADTIIMNEGRLWVGSHSDEVEKLLKRGAKQKRIQ